MILHTYILVKVNFTEYLLKTLRVKFCNFHTVKKSQILGKEYFKYPDEAKTQIVEGEKFQNEK